MFGVYLLILTGSLCCYCRRNYIVRIMTFSIYYAHTAPIQILTIDKLIVYRTVYIVASVIMYSIENRIMLITNLTSIPNVSSTNLKIIPYT